MLVAVSELGVALAGVIVAGAAAVLTAAIAATSSYLTARGNRQHERQLAHDARMFEARARAYEDVLTWAHRLNIQVDADNPSGVAGLAPSLAEMNDVASSAARLAIFGTERAGEAFGEYLTAATAAIAAIKGGAAPSAAEHFERTADQALHELEVAVRSELAKP